MKHSRAASSQTTVIIIIGAAVILFPLILALAWGRHYSTANYTLLHFARKLAGGGGISIDSVGNFPTPNLNSILFAFFVSIPVRIGIEPDGAALILSAIGWSAAALAILAIGKSLNRFRGAMVTALLLSFSPAIIATLGGPISWIVAFGWLTLALLLRRRLVAAVFTFFLFTMLLIPWPLNGGWSQLSHYITAISWSIFLFAAGVGLDWLAEELVNRDRTHLPYPQMANWLLVTVFILLGTWQGIRLWQLYQERPERLWQLEEDVATWLQSETDTSATVLANERVGYLAQRPTAAVPDLLQLEMAAAVQNILQSQPLDYVVTTNEFPWQQLQNLVWFRLAYEPVEQFTSAYLPQAPLTIWAYRQPVVDLGQRETINARVPDRLWIIGYQIGPRQVRAGETMQMVLYIEAPEATFEAPTPFQAIIRLVSPIGNSTVREWTIDLPHSISPEKWQANQVIVEQFGLKMPDEVEAGAYLLNLSLLGPASENLWPFSLDGDVNRLDRIVTGYVIVPMEDQLDNLQAAEATFGSGIQLSGFTSSEVESGEVLDVVLAWDVEQVVGEDYVVFVHLLDNSGQLVANHDGIPGSGRFPTRSWQPGITIPDPHAILLPSELPTGEYTLKVGLYDPATGQRLTATTAAGTVPEDSSIVITTINIP